MRKKAFTLVELIVVISVIALLMAILMPVLVGARQRGKSIVCLSNLRQMVIAANNYVCNNDGYYPVAGFFKSMGGLYYCYECDFIKVLEFGVGKECKPGLLWQGSTTEKIQQCPNFRGKANSPGDPYTGYNYNTSYIGSDGENPPQSAKAVQVKLPALTALFGDGQWRDGANKYMRAPWPNPRDGGFSDQYAGTQGYRHLRRTNVAFCDGHTQSWEECYKNTVPTDVDNIAEGTGFLSPDNSLYDLE